MRSAIRRAVLMVLAQGIVFGQIPSTGGEGRAPLQSHPAAWEHGAARAALAGALDRQVTVQVRDAMTDEERARLRRLLEFYRRRVDASLDALEDTPVSAGVLVGKFYSSSLVLKNAAGTVALDFCQGPINNGGEPEARDERRTGFYWTLAQRGEEKGSGLVVCPVEPADCLGLVRRRAEENHTNRFVKEEGDERVRACRGERVRWSCLVCCGGWSRRGRLGSRV